MIHDHQIYIRLKKLYETSAAMKNLAIQRVQIANYPEVPGPDEDEGGLKNFLPAVLITAGDRKNAWDADVNSNNQNQEYFVKIKFARTFTGNDNPHIVMPVALAMLMNVLKDNFTLDKMDLSGTAAPLSMSYYGEWDCQAESLKLGTTFIGVGYFQIKITLNQSLI